MSTARAALALAALMAFAGLLAVFYFGQQSLRLDEAQSLWQTSRAPSDILTIIAKDVHVPLYHMLLHFWRVFLGSGVEAARMMSLLLYLLSIPALYALGKLAYNQSVGLFAAALLAISPFMNWYGSEIRMYALFTLVVILNQYFFVKIFKNAHTDAADHTWAGYAITAVLGVFSHYFFFLVLLSQAAFFLLRRPIFPQGAFKHFTLSWALVALAILPWALFVLAVGEIQNQQPVLTTPTTVSLFSTLSQFLFGFQDDHLNTFFLSLWPLTLVLGFLALRKTRRMAPETEYFMLSLIMSVAVAFFASFALTPVFVSRYLILAVPSLYLLLTGLFSVYPPRVAVAARATLVVLMLVTLGIEMASPTTPVKENYREAAEYLTQSVSGADVVVLSAPFTVYPVEYYYRGAAPIVTLPQWDRYAFGAIPAFNPDTLENEVMQVAESHQNMWVLLSYDQGYEQQVREYLDTHFERVLEQNFSPGLNLYVYKLRYDTPLADQPPPTVSLAH